MHTGRAGEETQRHARGAFRSGVGECIACEEWVIQRFYEIPVFRVPLPFGPLRKSPDGVANGALCDHTDVPFLSQWQQIVDSVLFKDIERELNNVELIRFDGITDPLTAAGVGQEPNLAGLAGLFQGFDNLTSPEYLHRAAVQMNDIQVIRLESLQTSIDRSVNRRRGPVTALSEMTILVADLRTEHVFVTSRSDRVADEYLGMVFVGMSVTLGCVNDVQARVQGLIEQPGYGLLLGTGQPDGQTTETYDRHTKIGAPETAVFDAFAHGSENRHAGHHQPCSTCRQ
ncbi:hypothetical protein MnTg04_00109 [bacterium MnTg04]|nr:hypothetical protein MnTg04_00109 [bacterium MnTg04]